MSNLLFETIKVPEKPTYLAPDGSEIRLLPRMKLASFAHCILPNKGVTKAIRHRTVDEFWYFTAGQGEVWRKQGKREDTVKVMAGVSLTIPQGTHFQFRNTGDVPLEFLIASMPPWPIPHDRETVDVPGKWPPLGS